MNRFLVLDAYNSQMSDHTTLDAAIKECAREAGKDGEGPFYVAEIVGVAGPVKTPAKYTSLKKRPVKRKTK